MALRHDVKGADQVGSSISLRGNIEEHLSKKGPQVRGRTFIRSGAEGTINAADIADRKAVFFAVFSMLSMRRIRVRRKRLIAPQHACLAVCSNAPSTPEGERHPDAFRLRKQQPKPPPRREALPSLTRMPG